MSTEPTTEMMNEVIGIFMGGKWEVKVIAGRKHRRFYYSDKLFTFVKDTTHLNYHKSWDELMPVGKKIRDLLNDMQKKRPPHTACHGDMIEVDIHCAVSEYDIVNAHKHMYTFITWYNEYQQKQSNEQ